MIFDNSRDNLFRWQLGVAAFGENKKVNI